MKKGFYFIGVNDTDKDGKTMFIPELQEGSVEYYDNLYIHRKKDYEGHPDMWRLSHRNTGASILTRLDLPSARMLAKLLQPFKIWNIESYEAIKEAIAEGTRSPEAPYYEELKQIREIRYMRA